MPQGVFDRGLQVAELAAAVVALAREAVGVHRLLPHEGGDTVGQLDLPACPAPDSLQVLEDRRRQHVTAHHRKVGGRLRGLGFLNDAAHAAGRRTVALHLHDAVFFGLAARHHLHAKDTRALGLVHLRHLRQAGDFAADQVIGQVHEERFGADRRLRAQHRVAETQRGRLADVDARGVGGQHAAQLVEQVALALLLEHGLELLVGVEVVLDGALGGAGDEHQAARAGGQRLLDGVLDQWLVNHRQHLLRARLGRRQEARAAPGHRKHRGADHRLRAAPHRGSFTVLGFRERVISAAACAARQPPRRQAMA